MINIPGTIVMPGRPGGPDGDVLAPVDVVVVVVMEVPADSSASGLDLALSQPYRTSVILPWATRPLASRR